MRYSFKKDNGTDALGVYLNHNKEQIFVCWLYPHEVLVGERKTDAVDRMLFQAGYTGRLDFWETKKGVLIMNDSVKNFITKNFGETVYFYKHSDCECEVKTEKGVDLTVNSICSIGEIIGYEITDLQNQKSYEVLV